MWVCVIGLQRETPPIAPKKKKKKKRASEPLPFPATPHGEAGRPVLSLSTQGAAAKDFGGVCFFFFFLLFFFKKSQVEIRILLAPAKESFPRLPPSPLGAAARRRRGLSLCVCVCVILRWISGSKSPGEREREREEAIDKGRDAALRGEGGGGCCKLGGFAPCGYLEPRQRVYSAVMHSDSCEFS
ncbi:unnamed protein product [Caretta caretta]